MIVNYAYKLDDMNKTRELAEKLAYQLEYAQPDVGLTIIDAQTEIVRVFSFQKFIGEFYADLMSFLIRYFSGHKCLNQMESFVWVCLIGF